MKQITQSQVPISCEAISLILLKAFPDGMRALIMKRAGGNKDGFWAAVAGGIEAQERAQETALRECKEETQLTPDRLYSADFCEMFYDEHRHQIEIFPVFVGFIDSEQEVVLNEEHSAFLWLDLEAALSKMAFPAQKDTLKKVWAYFVEQTPCELLRIHV